jgi:glucose/arabinose dehydrogenase
MHETQGERKMQKYIFIAWIVAQSAWVGAQPAYGPGTFKLTPKREATLQPVSVQIPPEFDHLPRDLTLNLPPGFSASVFSAHDFNRPRLLAFDARGVLHVADMNNKRIVALPDADGNGVADEAITIADGFRRAHSLAFLGDAMFVGDRHQIVRYRDVDGDGTYRQREVFADNIPSSGSHSTRTIVLDEKNGKVYLSVGWPCDMCRLDEPERGVILEFNMDGTGRRVFAHGVRNVVGMDLHPETNQLWGTNNGHDREGSGIPPEWVDIIREDGFYGVPLAYGYRSYIDFDVPEYKENLPLTREDSLLVERMERPVALLPAHTAPMDIHFYRGDLFPQRYSSAAFVALHAGHAKLAPSPGYKVVALFTKPDGSEAYKEDFVTGFQTGTEMEDVWGYPVGITTDSAGRMYISSDKNVHAILRIDHSPIVARAEFEVADSVYAGADFSLAAVVNVERGLPDGSLPEVVADLSAFGGASASPLTRTGEGEYTLSASLNAGSASGVKTAFIHVKQGDGNTVHEVRYPHTLVVMPSERLEDRVVFDDALSDGWRVQNKAWSESHPYDLNEDAVVFGGERSASFRVFDGDWDWVVRFRPGERFDTAGYESLRFAVNVDRMFHPRQQGPTFSVYMGETLYDLFGSGLVDTAKVGWQEVEVPLGAFQQVEMLEEISFSGNFSGRFYLDEIRLVGGEIITAVEETTGGLPRALELRPNAPNPFNSGTLIRYAIPADLQVSIDIFNAAGQRVTKLVRAMRRAGNYEVYWDGRDALGNDVASGVYLCQLRVTGRGLRATEGLQMRTQKLLLVR